MKPRPIDEAADEELRGVLSAAARAALRAREIAARTGTAVVYERDGKLVYEYPTLDEFPKQPPVVVPNVTESPRH